MRDVRVIWCEDALRTFARARRLASLVVIPGWSEGPDPESRDSGFDASQRPGMTMVGHTLPLSASPISSSTLGSAMVAGIVHASPSAIFLMVPRRIFPERVFGNRPTVIA